MPSIDLEIQNRTLSPFAVRPTGDRSANAAVAIATEQRSALSAHLLHAGALLFRGFDLRTPEDFSRLVDAFSDGAPRFGYAGGASPRRALSGGSDGLYSSTEYPPEMELSLDNELSYADVHPRHLFFFCLVAPEQGGASTLGDSRRILRRIDPDVLDLFRSKGVRYIRNLPPAPVPAIPGRTRSKPTRRRRRRPHAIALARNGNGAMAVFCTSASCAPPPRGTRSPARRSGSTRPTASTPARSTLEPTPRCSPGTATRTRFG